MRYNDIDDAYRNDATFRTVVDTIEAMIHRADITPAEARGAAVLACIHYEARSLRTFTIKTIDGGKALEDAQRRIDSLKRWISEEA